MRQVIYIWNYLDWGGAQIYFFGLIKEVKKHSKVLVALPVGSNTQLLKFIENLGVDYEFFDGPSDIAPAKSIRRKIERRWTKRKSEKAMLRYLSTKDLTDTVIHVELAPWQSLRSLVTLCRSAPVFITMHNSLPKVSALRTLIWKFKFSIIAKYKTFHIFTSNEDAKKSLKSLVPKVLYDKILVTFTNVDPEEVDQALTAKIDRDEILSKFDIAHDSFLVFCVGQFIDRKGRWTFLEAAKEAFENDPSLTFVWIANSQPSSEDLLIAESYGLEKHFVIITSDQVGPDHIDLFKLLRLADLFALVSFQEGLPISLLEAMALGIPSISTNVNAIPEAVKHLETGWLIEAGELRTTRRCYQNVERR